MVVYPNYRESWKDDVYDINTPASTFGELQSFVELWRSKWTDGRTPAWKNFELEDFKAWYGWICVYDIIGNDPFDFRARLWGSYIVDLMGYDLTGKSPRINYSPPYELSYEYVQDDMEFMAELQQESAIGFTQGSVNWEFRSHIKYNEVFLPLSTDGKIVDKILSATYKCDR